jgi:hypothetical protein
MKPSLILFLLLAASRCFGAETSSDNLFPVRGLCIAAPAAGKVPRFVDFIQKELVPRSVNTLILRVDYRFEFVSHPELRDGASLSAGEIRQIVQACRQGKIHLIPQINLLGHQSWANRTGALLRVYPEFDETPWVTMPEKYAWPNPDKLYCKSYCPLHPKVHQVVFALVDEICDAFETDAFHAGMDEVFYLGEDKCPRCSGRNKAELFAGELRTIREHLAAKGRKLWIWGDRLLDGSVTGLGEWEASMNATYPAIDLVPKDIVICDWHYERAEKTAIYFAMKGFEVVTCPWKNSAAATEQVRDIVRFREQPSPAVGARVLGIVQTVWSGAESFLDAYDQLQSGRAKPEETKTEARCFVRVFDEIKALAEK